MYLALYRKWRPKTFDDVVGQEHITKTLKNEVSAGKTAHSYLFTGSRGTGKTTCSKILAMAVNCLHPVDGNPCMECEVCRGIEDGSILDVLEIDAASNNGVDDVRILREEANYTPAQCRYRVYIIDETHMLSTSAFNALLKIMEEPPEHVKFILATTEVHKVPATVLSRCQRFDFVRIKTEEIARRLLYISSQEAFELTEEAAFLIARLADGGMRDALSILDQCIAFSDQVNEEVVSNAAGLVSREYLFEIARVIAEKDPSRAIDMMDKLYIGAKDLQKLIGELIDHFRNLMIVKTVDDPKELVRCLPEELSELKEQSRLFPLAEVLRILSVLQDCLDKIGRDFDKRLTVEMTMIQLCSPKMDDSTGALLQRIEWLENQLRQLKATGLPAAVSQQEEPISTGLLSKAEECSSEPDQKKPAAEISLEPVSDFNSQRPFELELGSDMSSKQEEAEQRETVSARVKGNRQETAANVPVLFEPWIEVLGELKQTDPVMASVLSGSVAYAAGNILYVDSPMSLFANMNQRDTFVKTLIQILENKTGIRYKVRMKKGKKKEETAKNDPLTELEQQAAALGIEVESK